MKKYLVLFLLLLGAGTGFSQSPWQATTPFPKQDPFASATLATSPITNHFFVTVEEEGLLRSTTAGDSWERVLDEPTYAVAVRADGVIFAGGIGTVYVSSDQGATWRQYTLGASDSPVSKIVFNSQGHVFVGTSDFAESSNSDFTGDGIFTSSDNGQTWQQLNSGLEGLLAIEALAIDAQDRLYAGISDERSEAGGGIYTLAAGSTTWSRLPFSFGSVSDFRINVVHYLVLDKGSNRLYTTIEGSKERAVILRTLVSDDGGATWSIISLGESPYGELYDDFAFYNLYPSKSGILWGCMQVRTGIAYSLNNGQSWNLHTAGIGPSNTLFLFTETATNQILTLRKYDGNIVYKANVPLHVEHPKQAATLTLSAFPNPFTTELKIDFSVAKPTAATLIVTDALGRQKFVQQLNAISNPTTVTWQHQNLPAGVYFVRLQAGQQHVVQKVILAR